MDVKEIGEVLKNARITQGWTWEDIYSETKISPYILQHLEEGSLEGLPHPVYIKGFIKSYAQFLGLSSRELAQEFAHNLSLDEEEEEEQKSSNILESSSYRSKMKFIVPFFVLVLLILAWFLFKGFFYTSSQNTAQINQNPAEQKTNMQKDSLSAKVPSKREKGLNKTATQKEPPDRNHTQQNSGSPQARIKNSKSRNASLKQTNSNKNDSSTRSAEKKVHRDSSPEKTHVLSITANRLCWLRAEVDKQIKDVYLRPGEKLKFEFEQNLTLKLGNAGGVELRYDGEKYPLEADLKEVKVIKLP